MKQSRICQAIPEAICDLPSFKFVVTEFTHKRVAQPGGVASSAVAGCEGAVLTLIIVTVRVGYLA